MKSQKVKKIMNKAICNMQLANVYLKYNYYYINLIPLKASEKLFLAVNEDDFILDGYRVSRFKDVEKVKIKNDKCIEILNQEGVTSNIVTPPVCVDNWKSCFESLKLLNKNVIIEKETLDGQNNKFVIGQIEKIRQKHVCIRHFDADGIRQDKPYKIPYSEITSVTIESRYLNVFSKYLPEYTV